MVGEADSEAVVDERCIPLLCSIVDVRVTRREIPVRAVSTSTLLSD